MLADIHLQSPRETGQCSERLAPELIGIQIKKGKSNEKPRTGIAEDVVRIKATVRIIGDVLDTFHCKEDGGEL